MHCYSSEMVLQLFGRIYLSGVPIFYARLFSIDRPTQPCYNPPRRLRHEVLRLPQDPYRTGFPIAFALHSVDPIQSLDSPADVLVASLRDV